MTKRSFLENTGIVWKALFHKRTPLSAKVMLIGALLYGVLPIDLIPDLLPLLGIADDAVVILGAFLAFLHWTKDIRAALQKEGME